MIKVNDYKKKWKSPRFSLKNSATDFKSTGFQCRCGISRHQQHTVPAQAQLVGYPIWSSPAKLNLKRGSIWGPAINIVIVCNSGVEVHVLPTTAYRDAAREAAKSCEITTTRNVAGGRGWASPSLGCYGQKRAFWTHCHQRVLMEGPPKFSSQQNLRDWPVLHSSDVLSHANPTLQVSKGSHKVHACAAQVETLWYFLLATGFHLPSSSCSMFADWVTQVITAPIKQSSKEA
jgi:hypothetical protein